jgi:hypothetical protein
MQQGSVIITAGPGFTVILAGCEFSVILRHKSATNTALK